MDPRPKRTFRVLNEPFKIMGIVDWRYFAACAVLALFFGFAAHSKVAAIIVLAALVWRTYGMSEEDPKRPFAWWSALTDKRKLCPFARERMSR